MTKIKRIDNIARPPHKTMRAVKIAHGNANTTLMLENSLADIYKVKHVLII